MTKRFDKATVATMLILESYGFWKVMDIDNAILQDIASFGKGRFLK